MRVTGYFPVDWYLSGDLWVFSHGSTPGDHSFKQSFGGVTGKSMLAPTVEAAFSRDANTFVTGSPRTEHYGPYNCTFSGPLIPNPPDKYFSLPRKKVSTDFYLAKEKGEIAVSDYTTGQARATYVNGFKTIAKGGSDYGARYSGQDFLFERCASYGSNRASRVGGLDWVYTFNIRYEEQTREIGVSPYEVGWDDLIIEDLLALRPRDLNQDEVVSSIMEATASANRGIIDFATSLAEMPETIRYIYDLCKQILKIYKDAKQREFRVRNRVKGRQNTVDWSNRQWTHDRKEEADAVARVWLEARYAIEPVSYMIQDALDLLDKYANEFFRWRHTCETATPLDDLYLPNGWTCDSEELTSKGRAFIKRGINVSSLGGSVGNLASIQPLVTLWELGTLSFVVDWVLNVGNFLSCLSSPTYNYVEGATFSWKNEQAVKFTHGQSGATVLVDMRTYDRKVITPSDYCRLIWNPDITGKRQIDAMALSWSLFLRDLKFT